eukprot:8797792-Pyramimonas_sp.AAC.1
MSRRRDVTCLASICTVSPLAYVAVARKWTMKSADSGPPPCASSMAFDHWSRTHGPSSSTSAATLSRSSPSRPNNLKG